MADQENFNPDYSSELSIEAIISAPLIAASKANVVMVKGQTRALLDNCFEFTPSVGDPMKGTYKPILIEMTLKKGFIDPDLVEQNKGKNLDEFANLKMMELKFSIPLLCLVPINNIVVDNVTVDFDMEITSVIHYKNEKEGILPKHAQLNGRIKSDPAGSGDSKNLQNKTQNSSKLKVHINAGPLPLPNGLLTILELYTKSIQPLPTLQDKKPDAEIGI